LAGTVTAARLRAGDVIESGTIVAEVNREAVIALTTTHPLYRDLRAGDRGQDVADLVEVLQRLDLLGEVADPSRFTSDVGNAVRRLNYLRAVDSPVFRVQSVMFIEQPFTVGVSHVNLGAPAPGAGEKAFESEIVLSGASVVGAGEEENLPPLEFGTEPRMAAIEGQRFDLTGRNQVIDLARLASLVDPTVDEIDPILVQLVTPRRTHSLPAPAVVVDANGSTCVYGEDETAARVTIVGAAPGTVELAADPPGKVILNPIAAGLPVTCGP
jgi:hypothetical protein